MRSHVADFNMDGKLDWVNGWSGLATKTMNTIRFLTLTSLLMGIEIGRADPLDTWTWRNPLPTGEFLFGITYGGGRFVAVGASGAILTSVDGQTSWVQRESGTANQLLGITYGNGLFVAV